MAQAHEARDRLCAAWMAHGNGGNRARHRQRGSHPGPAACRDRRQGIVDQGTRWLAGFGRDRFRRPFDEGRETIRPAELAIAAVLPRADVRDVLVGAESVAAIPRRAGGHQRAAPGAQMLHARPDLSIVPFRGNVATRLAKLQAGEADVTLLAAAGLARLNQTGVGHPLPTDHWLPAPAQGAIGIECLTARADLRGWLAAIDHAPTHAAVRAERALLLALGGNCHSPIALHTQADGDG
jgi:hydroxymethylbilane synthase